MIRALAVASLDDPRIAAYRNVRDADLRARDGLFLAEGRLAVQRLITASRYRTRSVFASDTALREIRPAVERLSAATPVYVAPQALLCAVVGYPLHQGCLAAGERGGEPDLASLIGSDRERPRTLVVLEDVGSAENAGAVFRNALAFGADGVVLTQRCVDPLYRRAIRVSMGATLRVPFARAGDGPSALAALRDAGFAQVALTTDPAATPIAGSGDPPRRLALWLGSEGAGLSDVVRSAVERYVTIPMAPGADSLNVATACGIALHHWRALGARTAAPGAR